MRCSCVYDAPPDGPIFPCAHDVATFRYRSGVKLQFSTAITGLLSYGYGGLDVYGFWQYPLEFRELNPSHRRMVMRIDGRELH